MHENRNDGEGHHRPDERSVQRRDSENAVGRVEEGTDPRQPHYQKQEYGGPSESHANVHQQADEGSWRAAVKRFPAEQCTGHSLKEARCRRMVEDDAQDAGEESVDDGRKQSSSNKPGELGQFGEWPTFSGKLKGPSMAASTYLDYFSGAQVGLGNSVGSGFAKDWDVSPFSKASRDGSVRPMPLMIVNVNGCLTN